MVIAIKFNYVSVYLSILFSLQNGTERLNVMRIQYFKINSSCYSTVVLTS